MNSIKSLIKKNYSLNVENIKKIKNVYRITSGENDYCLKVVKYEYGHFLFILKAMEHLVNNGFSKIPEIIKKDDGSEYMKLGKNFAYLTPWINARECNYDNPIDVIRASKKLAELHKKSEGFKVTPDMNPRVGWFKWLETYETREKEIISFKDIILKKDSMTEFDRMYISMMMEEVERCQKSIGDIKNSGYDEKMKSEIQKNGFCHHDYAHHNVLIDNNDEINIIDFDYCMLDTHLHDLSSILIRVMKNGKWDINTALIILDAYDSVNGVFKSDIPLMASFMEFPQEYWQTGIQYYWEKQDWGEEFFLKKLEKIRDDREERQNFVDEFRTVKYGR